MIKYVRTKDGIYELMPNISQDYEMSFDGETLEPAYYTIDTDWIAKKDVIDQADTIEELCDEFVVCCDSWEKPLVHDSDKTNKEQLSDLKNILKNDKVYGAIWTDKGLIFVAKLNNKGKLELL